MKAVQWTVFIDMLGFSELNSTVTSDDQAQDLIEFMTSNTNILLGYEEGVRKAYEDDKTFNLYQWYDVKSTFISDSIVLTFKPKEVMGERSEDKALMHSANALMLICMRLSTLMHKCLLERKITFRGGISTEYCDIKDNFAVGAGVIAAYVAESKKARYARLALADDVVENDKLINKIKWLFRLMYGDVDFLIVENGVTYVNVLNLILGGADPRSPSVAGKMRERAVFMTVMNARANAEKYLAAHKQLVVESISKFFVKYRKEYADPKRRESNRNLLKKYFWLRRHHNSTIKDRRYDDYLI